MKRYAIVRVDGICPTEPENLSYDQANEMFNCNCGNDENKRCKNYGDTKEQLIRKVAQALIIDEMERYRKTPNCDVNKTIFDHESKICLEKAKFIVEFLGVEE